MLGVVRAHIARDVEVVVVGTNLVTRHAARKCRRLRAIHDGIDNALDVRSAKPVLLTDLDESARGIDNQRVLAVAVLSQDHHNRRNARPEEDVRGQPNDRVNVIPLHELHADLSLGSVILLATEKNPVRHDNRHDAVRPQMIEIMEKKGIVGLGLGGKSELRITRIAAASIRIPVLRIRRIGYDRVHKQRLVGVFGIRLVEIRPVAFQRIAVPHFDICGTDAAHDEIHARQVVGVFLQLLGIVLDAIRVIQIARNRPTDVDQKRPRTARRIIDPDLLAILQMLGDDFRHEEGNLMRRIELARLLPRVRGEHADQILIDETEDVIVLASVHGNVPDEIEERLDGFRLRGRGVTELAQSRFERIENVRENLLVRRRDHPRKGRKRIAHVRDIESRPLGKPSRKEMLVRNEVADMRLDEIDGLGIRFVEFLFDRRRVKLLFASELFLAI